MDERAALNNDEKRRGKSVLLQVTLAVLSNFSNISPAMSIGFSAVAIPALTHLNRDQISWFASIASLAIPIGCLICGPIADRFGRRCSIGVVNVTALLGWSVVTVAYYTPQSHQYGVLLCGRFLTGIATGLCGTPAAIYMAEVASSELRSVFTTWVSLFYAIGILFVYLLGFLFKDDWGAIALIAAFLPILGMIFLLLFIPESPPWLVTKQRYKQAERNLCKLYDTKELNKEVREELESLINNGNIKTTKTTKTLPQQVVKKLKMLMKRSFIRPYLLIISFFVFQQSTGIFSIMFYAIDVVQGAGVQLDSYITIVIIASVRVVGMVLLSFLSKHFGRRPLSLSSGVGITISMISLGIYVVTVDSTSGLGLIPLLLLITYFLTSTFGFYAIPFAITSEIYPRNIRGTAAGISNGTNFVFNFVAVKLYPWMVSQMGSHGVFFFYGTMGLVGTVFVYFCLPETRGKTLDEIQAIFDSRKDKKDVEVANKEDTT